MIVRSLTSGFARGRMLFVRAYPRETQEMVFDTHGPVRPWDVGVWLRGLGLGQYAPRRRMTKAIVLPN